MMVRTARRRTTARLILATVIVGAAVYVYHPWPRTGADRVEHLVDWPSGCEAVTTRTVMSLSPADRWTAADERSIIQCQLAGESVVYVRFRGTRDRDQALATAPPSGLRICLYEKELVIDRLESGFDDLCAGLGGRIRRYPRRLVD